MTEVDEFELDLTEHLLFTFFSTCKHPVIKFKETNKIEEPL